MPTILLIALWTTIKPTMWKINAATTAWPRFMRDEIIEASVLTAVVAICAYMIALCEPRLLGCNALILVALYLTAPFCWLMPLTLRKAHLALLLALSPCEVDSGPIHGLGRRFDLGRASHHSWPHSSGGFGRFVSVERNFGGPGTFGKLAAAKKPAYSFYHCGSDGRHHDIAPVVVDTNLSRNRGSSSKPEPQCTKLPGG